MPDDPTTIATDAPAGPSQDAPVTDASAEVAAPETTTTTEPDIWERIAALDPDELVRKHPRLSGKVGEMAEKQASRKEQALRKSMREEVEAEIEARELERLRHEDPATFIEKLDERDAKKAEADRKASEEEAKTRDAEALAQATWGDVDAMLINFHSELPESVQKATAKNYEGTPVESRKAYLKDVVEAMVHHRLEGEVAKARTKWEKEGRSALRKDALSELNGGRESPDVNGNGAGGGAITIEEIERHRGDQQWFVDNYDKVSAAVSRARR